MKKFLLFLVVMFSLAVKPCHYWHDEETNEYHILCTKEAVINLMEYYKSKGDFQTAYIIQQGWNHSVPYDIIEYR